MADANPPARAGHEPAAPSRPDPVNGKLKPCPFCSGTAVRKDDPGVIGVPFGLIVDHAPGCFLAMPFCTDNDAIDRAWNIRPAREEVSGEEVERMARAICAEDPDIRMGDAEGVVQQRVEQHWRDYVGHARAAIAAMTPKTDEAASGAVSDAQLAAAARKALGEWLAWPDAPRDGPVPVDNEKTESWLHGLPNALAHPPTADVAGLPSCRVAIDERMQEAKAKAKAKAKAISL